ncbi:hypothetical protein [Streptomyces sp. NPDC093225]|uniref:hypothetical protein n=1 Tax=Streptomyces sp. NPDC093225 TaxID=3366034 RepID=UPI0037F15EB7
MIAVALVHPDTDHAAGYLHGCHFGYTDRGWLATLRNDRDPRSRPTRYSPTPPCLPLPHDAGMAPAHYSVHVEARRTDDTSYTTLLRLGHYTQTWLASRDADRLDTELARRAAFLIPSFTVTPKDTAFDASDYDSYTDSHDADVTCLLAAAVAEVTGVPATWAV